MSDIDGLEMKTRVDEILHRHPALGFALGVVRNGSLEFFHTHGFADLASNRPVAEDTVFRVASITKTFTAIAVMQLWEQGLIDIDAPANDYLRAYQLIPANTSWRPATVRHLLTHTAGIPEQVPRSGIFRTDFGESVKRDGRPLPRRLLPRWAGPQRGAGHHVPVRRPRAGDARPDCRGRVWDVLEPLPPRARLRTPRYGRHHPHTIRGGPVAARDRVQAELDRPQAPH